MADQPSASRRKVPWEDREEGVDDVKRDLRILLRGVRRRWFITFLLALTVSLGAVALKSRKQPKHTVDVVIRITEKKFDENTRPPTQRDIRKYLYDVALSRTALLALIKTHDLYPDKMFDPTWAVETMKEDIELFVLTNYFSPETYIENPLREMRLVVTYAHTDPEKALLATREMGKLIAQEQSAVRKRVAMKTAVAGADAAVFLEQELRLAKREIAELNAIRDKNPLALVRLHRLAVEVEAMQEELGAMSNQATRLGLRGELEKKQGGLEFELVDEGRPPKVVIDTRTRLILIGVFLFLFSLPVIGIGVASIDPIIYDRDGIRRLRLGYVGRLPVTGNVLDGRGDKPRGKRGKLSRPPPEPSGEPAS